MKKMILKVKTGWVYLFGTILLLGLAGLAINQNRVLNAKATTDQPKQVQNSQNTAPQGISNATQGQRAPETQQNQPKTASAPKNTTKTTINPVSPANSSVNTAPQTQPVSSPAVPAYQKSITLNIIGLGSYNVPIYDGDNGFTVLKRAANQNGFQIEYKTYSWGVMITKIGNTAAAGTYYWALYYNGGYSDVGASDLIVKDKDVIKWSYESWM